MTDQPLHVSPAMEAAWRTYQQGIEELRRIIFAHPFAEKAQERDEANYLFFQLQAEAFNIAMVPRPDYPQFYSLLEPMIFTWGLPCPDMIYSRLYLDGRRTYRLAGKRSNSLCVIIQSINAHFTLPPSELKLAGDFNLDDFKIDVDGSFEIILSGDRHDGNWIPLDPEQDRNFIFFREVIPDWDLQERTEMRIERIDDAPAGPITYGEADMIRRMQGAVHTMKALASMIAIGPTAAALEGAGVPNQFANLKLPGSAAAAAAATYSIMRFDLGPDEAMIVELDPPDPIFWDIQAGDTWNQAFDYTDHQTSLSMTQASVDDDGKIRIVMSARDPGVRNWVDCMDNRRGVLFVRWYFAKRTALPAARIAPFSEIKQHLPAETEWVTPEQRQADLVKRRHGIKRRKKI